MRSRMLTVITLTLVLGSFVNARAVSVVPVKNTRLFEVMPESTTYNGQHIFAWTRTATPKSVGHGWNVIVSIGGPGRQVSSKGAYAWPGGFDEMGRLIFQQALPRTPADSNLYMWSAGVVRRLPSAVNNRYWQYGGDRWGDWLVYGENRFERRDSPWRIVVYNFSTGVRRSLMNAPYSCHCLSPGNVVGSLTAFHDTNWIDVVQLGPPHTGLGRTHPPRGLYDDDPFIVEPTPDQPNSGDETLFWVRSRKGQCGQRQWIMRAPLDDLSAGSVVAAVGTGDVNSLSVDDSSGAIDVYFGHQTCTRIPRSDIFEIPNV
jgi:hypothetical protein